MRFLLNIRRDFIIHFICPKQPLHSTLQAVLPQADQSDKYHDKITTSRIPQNISSYMSSWTHEPRYQSARCLMCGCCLEVCPNFSANGTFAGAVAAVNAFRILNEEQESTHLNEISAEYKKRFYHPFYLPQTAAAFDLTSSSSTGRPIGQIS